MNSKDSFWHYVIYRFTHVTCILLLSFQMMNAQSETDTVIAVQKNADDPSKFFTRLELFSEYQEFDNNVFINITTLRTNIKIGKRFTTRLDIPFVYNNFGNTEGNTQSGIGDISFRLLGYRFFESKRSAFTASIEINLNTAASPYLGTGKNLFIPMVTYTTALPDMKGLFAIILQQANSFGGDENRKTISFTKGQFILSYFWEKNLWSVLAPEVYIDYVNGGVSMNLESRLTYAPVARINVWVQGGVGVFGDFIARYNWGTEAGVRYYLFKVKE